MSELRDLDKASAEAKTDGSGKDSDTDDTILMIPELEEAAGDAVGPGGLPMDMVSKPKQSRGEKKLRNIMSKLRLKPDEENMLSTKTGSSTNQMTCLTIPSQNRGSETKMLLGKYNITKTGKRKHQYKILEENIGQPSISLSANRPKRKSIKLVISKKHLLTLDSDDLESIKSVDTSIISDSNESFSPKSKYTNKNNTGRNCEVSLVDSDLESVNSTSSRYRKLRDTNNKAARKYKLKIKSREVELEKEAVQLEKDNRLLKIQAAILRRLIQIFLSEEPFINDVDSSCTLIPDKLSSPIDIHQDEMVAAEDVIKSKDTCAVTVEPIRQLEQPLTIPLSTMKVKPEPTLVFKMPECPKLKLDIEAAMMTSQTETIDTPEVPQPLVEEIKGFSLLSYDDEANVLSTITGSSTNQMTCLTIPPQKRGSETKMPLGRYNATKTAKIKHQYKTLDENTEQPSTLLVTNRPKRKSAENLKLVVSKKYCLTVDSVDLESMNSVVTSIVSDSDESFSAKSKSNLKKHTNKNNSGRKRKNQYRELRDRNNKASRKSRHNRKSRELEMKAQVVQLEKYNRLLKMKATNMVKKVKKLRELISCKL